MPLSISTVPSSVTLTYWSRFTHPRDLSTQLETFSSSSPGLRTITSNEDGSPFTDHSIVSDPVCSTSSMMKSRSYTPWCTSQSSRSLNVISNLPSTCSIFSIAVFPAGTSSVASSREIAPSKEISTGWLTSTASSY